MKQQVFQLLLTMLMSMVVAHVFAHDIEIKNADGVTIYYVWTNNNTELAVSYRGGFCNDYSNEYTGDIVIPESVTYDDKKYSVTSIGGVAFYACSGMTSITIPNSVTSIGGSAFYGCRGLTSITIPNSVTSIGKDAFYGCSGLTSITIPNSVTSIGGYAFRNCSGLTSITIPNSVTSIGVYAFYGCSGLTSISIPNSVTSIDYEAFSGCSGLTSISIPNSVTSIGENAFYGTAWYKSQPEGLLYLDNWLLGYKGNRPTGELNIKNETRGIAAGAFRNCTGLTSITIPNSVTSIGGSAFYGCSGLTSVTIPNSVTSIGYEAFSGCSGLTSITIPNSVTSIAGYAFSGCSGLTSITIPNSVTSIGGSAFSGCSNLHSVIIGTGVTSIGSSVFNKAKPQKVIWLTNTPPTGYSNASGTVNYVANDQYTSLSNKTVYPFLSSMFEADGVKYVPVSPSERTCHAIDCVYDSTAVNIKIGKTVSYRGIEMAVKEVRPYVCYGKQNVKSLELSFEGDLPNSAFSYVSGDYNAEINNSGAIGSNAFYGSTGMKRLTVGEQVTDISSSAFNSCTQLESAKLLNHGNISSNAFEECTLLESAQLLNHGSIAEKAFGSCSALKTVEFGEHVTEIGVSAFSGCRSLQAISIPDAVTSIGRSAFYGCSSMASARIGNGVQTINTYAFSGCSSLTDVQIGNGVQTIDTYAFSGCSKLPSISIPQKVTSIGNYAFSGCDALSKVILEDSETELSLASNGSNPLFSSCPLDSVYIGRNIAYKTTSNYGYSPFYRNTSLRSVTITDKETEISPNEFYGCTNLKNVRIGNSVKTIGDWAFSGCSSLDFFSFGSSVESIGKEAFSDCTAMTRLISRAAVPPTCGSQALDDINKWNCTLTVPVGYTSAYQQADQWKEFFFIDEATGIARTKTDQGEGYKQLFNLNGHQQPALRQGLNIIKKDDGTTKKVVVR